MRPATTSSSGPSNLIGSASVLSVAGHRSTAAAPVRASGGGGGGARASANTNHFTSRDAAAANEDNGLCRPAERWPSSLQERSERERIASLRTSRLNAPPQRQPSPEGPNSFTSQQQQQQPLKFRLVPMDVAASEPQTRVAGRYLEGLASALAEDSVVRSLCAEAGAAVVAATPSSSNGNSIGSSISAQCSVAVRVEPSAVWRVDSTAVDAMAQWGAGMVVKKVLPVGGLAASSSRTNAADGRTPLGFAADEAALRATGGHLSCDHHARAVVPGVLGFYFFNVYRQPGEAEGSGGGASATTFSQLLTAARHGVAEALSPSVSELAGVASAPASSSDVEVARGFVLLCCVRVGRLSMNQPHVVEGLRAEVGRGVASTSHLSPAAQCHRLREALAHQFASDSLTLATEGAPATVVFGADAVAATHVIEYRCTIRREGTANGNAQRQRRTDVAPVPLAAVSLRTGGGRVESRRPATAGPAASSSSQGAVSPESAARAVRQQMGLVAATVRQQFKDIMDAAAAKRDAMLVMLQQEEDRLVRAARLGHGGDGAADAEGSAREHIAGLSVATAEALRAINRLHIEGLVGAHGHGRPHRLSSAGEGQSAAGSSSEQQQQRHVAGGGAAAVARPGTASLLSPSQRRALGIGFPSDFADADPSTTTISGAASDTYEPCRQPMFDSPRGPPSSSSSFVINTPPPTTAASVRTPVRAPSAASRPLVLPPTTGGAKPPRPGVALGPDVMVSAAQRGSAGPRQLMSGGIPRPSTSGTQRSYANF